MSRKVSLIRFAELLPSPPNLKKRQQQEAEKARERNPLYRPSQLHSSPGDKVNVSLQDRWAIVGATGSGKTYFTKMLIGFLRRVYPASRVYVLDTKAYDDFTGWPGVVETDTAPDALAREGSVQVWKPYGIDYANRKDREQVDKWFGNILRQRKPAIVLVNEISSIGGTGSRTYPPNFIRLLRQGRSMDMTVIVETQRAAGIPPDVLAQMTHLVRFALRNNYDVRITDEHLFDDRALFGSKPPKPWGFFYKRVDSEIPVQTYEKAQQFFTM